MKYAILITLFAMSLASCSGNAASGEGKPDAGTTEAAGGSSSDEEYFTFSVDGKEMSIPAADVSTSYHDVDSSFRIMAGPDGGTSVVLTIPQIQACPCSVPAGSAVASDALSQGSVSLQNYPQKSYAFNSWYLTMHETPPVDAIKVSNLGTPKDGYRYITGTFQVKVLKTEANGAAPDNKDYQITNGRFRVRHDLHGSTTF